MRQGQNPKRSRGRGRKPQNTLSRNMESNGPDVKIRGTAVHIFEKYQALARDAQTSGDRIGAESYFQYAEHYHRLIVAAQAQQEQHRQENQPRHNGNGRDDQDNDGDDNGAERSARGNPAVDRSNGSADEPSDNGNDADENVDAPAAQSSAADASGDEGEEKPAPRRRAPRRRRTPKADGADRPAPEDVDA